MKRAGIVALALPLGMGLGAAPALGWNCPVQIKAAKAEAMKMAPEARALVAEAKRHQTKPGPRSITPTPHGRPGLPRRRPSPRRPSQRRRTSASMLAVETRFMAVNLTRDRSRRSVPAPQGCSRLAAHRRLGRRRLSWPFCDPAFRSPWRYPR